MRLKHRHMLLRVVYEDQQPDPTAAIPQLAKSISNSVESYFGDFGTIATRFAFQIKYFNTMTGLAIIRAPRNFSDTIVYAITSISKLNGKPCKIDILQISGTIHRCQRVAIELSRQYLKEIAFANYIKSKNEANAANSANGTTVDPAAVIVLTTDGDIIPDPATIEEIAKVEQEIEGLDAVQ